MCDFSLEHLVSRAAQVGDKLKLIGFHTGSKGFIEADGDEKVPVCLRPGTELAFADEITTNSGMFYTGKTLGTKVAVFSQIERSSNNAHRDGMEVAGTFVSLQRLEIGQQATVLQLPVQAKSEPVQAGPQVLLQKPEKASA